MACLLATVVCLTIFWHFFYPALKLRSLAEDGDSYAQYVYALALQYGLSGVTKNQVEAARWFQKSAEQNYWGAQLALGCRYAEGNGVTKDLIQAHAWLSLAKAQEGTNKQSIAWRLLPELEEKMSSEQKTEATKLARELSERFNRK